MEDRDTNHMTLYERIGICYNATKNTENLLNCLNRQPYKRDGIEYNMDKSGVESCSDPSGHDQTNNK